MYILKSHVEGIGLRYGNQSVKVEPWPAASNEGVPGVHVAVGGDPEQANASLGLGVHVDLISTSAKVSVNSASFELAYIIHKIEYLIYYFLIYSKKKVKQSRYMSWRHKGGEEV
jgi:hypothetical protein